MVRYRLDGNMHKTVTVVCSFVLLVSYVLAQELNIGKYIFNMQLHVSPTLSHKK